MDAPVRVLCHREGRVWWAESPDVEGWTAAGDSYAEVVKLAEEGIRFALEHPVQLEHYVPAGERMAPRQGQRNALQAIFGHVRSGLGRGGRAAFASLVALVSVAGLAPPAQGAMYAASVEVRESPTRIGSVLGFGKEISIMTYTTRRNWLFARYSGPGRTSRRGVFGRLGQFGSVALRFRPEGKPSRAGRRPDSCTGGPKVLMRWKGTFKGSIRFHPDAHLSGFARTGSFAGQLETVPRWHCSQAVKPPSFDPDAGGINVEAINCDGRSFDATVEVDPATPPPPAGDEEATLANFNASWTKSVGIAHVTYSISVEGGADTAVFSDDLSEGTITPPSPFHGQATIRRQGEDWEWSGSLSARLPGRTVRLTGPGFEPFATTFKPRPNTSFLFFHAVPC